MKKIKKTLFLISVFVLCFSCFAACSNNDEIASDGNLNKEQILNKYDAIANETLTDKPIGSDVSVLGSNFSDVDFTFTSSDYTVAYSLDKNSFAKLMPGGTFFNYVNGEAEVETFEPGFKTARGLSLNNTALEFISKYGLSNGNAVYLNPSDSVYYSYTGGNFSGKLTAVFASKDAKNYSMLNSSDVQTFLYQRDDLSKGAYIDPSYILSKFPDYLSISSIDISVDETGTLTEVAFYRFDK